MQRIPSLSSHSESDRTFVSYNSKTICFGDDCDLLSSNINSVSSKMTLLVSCWVRTDFRDLFGAVILQMITRSRVSSGCDSGGTMKCLLLYPQPAEDMWKFLYLGPHPWFIIQWLHNQFHFLYYRRSPPNYYSYMDYLYKIWERKRKKVQSLLMLFKFYKAVF